MIQHVKCDKIGDVDKFFEKSGMPLDQVKIVHVSTKMGGFYMVFYDDGLPYPEKKGRGKTAEKPATPGEVTGPSVVLIDDATRERLGLLYNAVLKDIWDAANTGSISWEDVRKQQERDIEDFRKAHPERPQAKQVAENFDPTVFFKDEV